jgi:antitoxin component YwqK of YwqJK toxin-antitoxin module
MKFILFLFFIANPIFLFAQTGKTMLYTNCSEVYDKGDTTICLEQIDEERQLIRYYLAGTNIFSKKYSVEKNGNYAFQEVVNDYASPKNGMGFYYYKNNQLQKILVYKNDLLYNCTEQYDLSGNLLPNGTLKDGNGTFIVYDENGLKKSTIHYKKGKVNRWKNLFG